MSEPPSFDYAKVAESSIEQVNAQIDLPLTLATAIVGGIVAVGLHLVSHNHGKGAVKIVLRGKWLLATSLVCLGLSIGFGYLAKSAVTNLAPAMLQMKAEAWTKAGDVKAVPRSLNEIEYEGMDVLRVLVQGQMFLFLGGCVVAGACALWNGRVLLGK